MTTARVKKLTRSRVPLKKALVVDSEPETAAEIGRSLEKLGFVVTAICHHSHMEDLLSHNRLDLVVMEICAPVPKYTRKQGREDMEHGRRTGLVLLRNIRVSQPDLPLPPVVVLTFVDRRTIDPDFLAAAGVTECLHKPALPKDFRAAIRRATRSKSSADS